jgi:TolB-like protein/Flp pilus assembly protein TadD
MTFFFVYSDFSLGGHRFTRLSGLGIQVQSSEHSAAGAERRRASSFTVGDWRVTRAMNKIERGSQSIQLEPLAMDVLVHLAAKPGEVVSIDELIARIWNGRATDGSVYRTINQLRRALEGDHDEARYIQTIRKRGYRLIAAVSSGPATQAPAAASAIPAARTSIAVLPFENLSPDRENAFFADGMHGEVLSQLAKISALRVISRTSVLEYRQGPKHIRKIAQELGVGAILEGTVQRSGRSARINVQLIDAVRDEHLWAHTYERTLTAENAFAIQSEIATAVAAALHAALLPHEAARLKSVPTQNAAAYDFYLAGTARLDAASYSIKGAWLEAVDAYTNAVREDPKFALAWAALSRVHGIIYHLFFDRTAARIEASLAALERARELDADMPEFHLAAGEYYYRSALDYAQAFAEFDLAARGMPHAPEPLIARALVYKRMGRWEQALETFEQAKVLDPRNPRLIFNEADTYVSVREYEVADEYLERVLAIDPSYINAHIWRAIIPLLRDGSVAALKRLTNDDNDWLYHLSWTAALYDRDYSAACRVLDDWPRDAFAWPWSHMLKSLAYGVTLQLWNRPDDAKPHLVKGCKQIEDALARSSDDPRLHITLGEGLAALGARDEAVRAAHQGLAMRPKLKDAYLGLVYQLDAVRRVLIRAGAIDEALTQLDEYLGTRGASWTIEGLLPDPRFDPIREHPRFLALVEKHRRR